MPPSRGDYWIRYLVCIALYQPVSLQLEAQRVHAVSGYKNFYTSEVSLPFGVLEDDLEPSSLSHAYGVRSTVIDGVDSVPESYPIGHNPVHKQNPVDEDQIRAEERRRILEEREISRRELEEKRQEEEQIAHQIEEEELRKREEEEKRKEEQQRQRAILEENIRRTRLELEEKKRQREEERLQEEQRIRDEERRAFEEERRAREEEKQRRLAEQREKSERRIREEERRRAEDDRIRREEQQRLEEERAIREEARRKEEERIRKEEEERIRQEEEERLEQERLKKIREEEEERKRRELEERIRSDERKKILEEKRKIEEEEKRKEEERREKIRIQEEKNRRDLERKKEEMRRKELEIQEMAEKQRREAVEKKVRELKERKAAEERKVAEEKKREEERKRREEDRIRREEAKREEERRRKEEEERAEREEKKRRKELEERIRREEREKFEKEENERRERERIKEEERKRLENERLERQRIKEEERKRIEDEKKREEEIRAEVRREMEAKMRREYGPSRRNVKVSKVLSNYEEREKKAMARLEKLRRPFKTRTDEPRVLKILPGGDFSASGEERQTKKREEISSLPDITEEFTLSPIEKSRNQKAVAELETLLLEKTDEPFAAARGIRTSSSHVIKTTNTDKFSEAPRATIKTATQDVETFLGGWDEGSREAGHSIRPKGLNVRPITKAPAPLPTPSHTIAPIEAIPPNFPVVGEDASRIVQIIEPTTADPPLQKISILAPIAVKQARPEPETEAPTTIAPTTTAATTKKPTDPAERTVDSLSDAEYDKFVRDYYSNYYKEYYTKLGLPNNDSTALADYYKQYYETYYTAATPTPFGAGPGTPTVPPPPSPTVTQTTPLAPTTTTPNFDSGFSLNAAGGGDGGLSYGKPVTPPPGYGSQPATVAAGPAPGLGIQDPRRPGHAVTEQDARNACKQISTQSKAFNIRDIRGFAKTNCDFIKSFYAGITCEQLDTLVTWCQSNGLL